MVLYSKGATAPNGDKFADHILKASEAQLAEITVRDAQDNDRHSFLGTDRKYLSRLTRLFEIRGVLLRCGYKGVPAAWQKWPEGSVALRRRGQLVERCFFPVRLSFPDNPLLNEFRVHHDREIWEQLQALCDGRHPYIFGDVFSLGETRHVG